METESVKSAASDEALKKFYEEKKAEYWKDGQKSTETETVYRPFAEVKDYVSFMLRSDLAEKMAGDQIVKAGKKAKEAKGPDGPDLEAMAKDLGLKYGTTEFFSEEAPDDPEKVWQDLDGIEELAQIAAKLKDGEVSADESLRTPSGRALVRRGATKKSYIPELSEVRDLVIEKVLDKKARAAAREFANSVLDKARETVSAASSSPEKADALREVVEATDYVADSVVRPVVRETEYFKRAAISGGYRGQPWTYRTYIPGLATSGRKGDLQNQITFEAFGLRRGRISDPVVSENDNTECFLIALSGQRVPSDEDFKKQGPPNPWSAGERFRTQEWAKAWSRAMTNLRMPPQ